MKYRDLAGVQIPAGSVVIVLTPGEEDQPPVRVAHGQATIAVPEPITSENPPRLQFKQFQFHEPQPSPRVNETLRELFSCQKQRRRCRILDFHGARHFHGDFWFDSARHVHVAL